MPDVKSITIWTMSQFTELEARLDRFFTTLFDDMPTSRVYALHMIVVGLSNIIDDGGNVNRALIQVWGIAAWIVHTYMLAIIAVSFPILFRRTPVWWWYLPGVSYIVLVLSSVVALAIVNPSITTLSTALRVFALNGLLFFILIKNLRSRL